MPRQIRDLLILLLLPPHSWPRLTVLRAVHGPDARGCSPREAGWLLCRIPPLGLAALWRRAYSLLKAPTPAPDQQRARRPDDALVLALIAHCVPD